MKRATFPVKKSRVKTWSEIFQNPRPVTVESLKTGEVEIQKVGTINPQHPKAVNVKDETLNVPIMAHIIHHEKFGAYLIDAGLDASYYNDPRGNVRGLLARFFADEFHQDKNQNIAFKLQKRHLKLKGVFLSHLHSDHMAGVRELPKDIQYVVGKGEKYPEYKPFLYGNYLKGIETLHEIDFSTVEPIPPLGPSADLLGDGSLWAVSTPGHTRGHMSFVVNGLEGPIFLTTDACFIREGLEMGVASSDYTWNVDKAQKSLDKILKFLNEYPEVKVICGHEDPYFES
ncbi:MBL fold metallo-hydrolase [Methanobacterium paludis]|uniref:Beta-lactamase domain-containing protein n=1 Tax=Methanobacterium paludis (strain DSM 25820 / JCM 18151 / SWAN1) TaxID=868131 RepID=F6D297_METPW|nr:MBL fold metallo-hydrolase [Methanobacterium paludis]AEG18614.1 beta-lactamase domain-containing protein [Methanobacterium paludis]